MVKVLIVLFVATSLCLAAVVAMERLDHTEKVLAGTAITIVNAVLGVFVVVVSRWGRRRAIAARLDRYAAQAEAVLPPQ